MTDRTAAALASALPAGMPSWDIGAGTFWRTEDIAAFQAKRLAESGWRLVHTDDHPQTFAEHYAEALALIHDHVEAGDAD
jgi:hypothetical protein